MRKPLIGILVSIVVFALLISNVYGAAFTAAEYPYGAADTALTSEIAVPHPSATAACSGYFFTFMTSYDGGNLSAVDYYLFKEGAPVGWLRCELYATSGTYGSTAVPTGSALDVCLVDYNMSVLLASPGGYARFNFANTTALTAGIAYAIAVWELNETTVDTSNGPRVYYDQVGSYSGNMGYYANSGWTAQASADDDTCFVVYVEGGNAVTYFGYNIFYGDTSATITGDITGSINATGAISAGNVSAGAVSAGDVTASGGTTVNVGGVTAEFNNTAVTAGDVTAGDVTATSSTASIESLIVNATVGENVTMTGDLNLATTAEPADFEFWFVIILILGCFALMFLPRIPIVNFVFGAFSLAVCGASLGSVILPFPWYMSFMLGISAVLCMLSGYINWRRE